MKLKIMKKSYGLKVLINICFIDIIINSFSIDFYMKIFMTSFSFYDRKRF